MVEACKHCPKKLIAPSRTGLRGKSSRRYNDPRSGDLLLVGTSFKKALRILRKLSGNQQIVTVSKFKRKNREGEEEVVAFRCVKLCGF